MSTASRYRLVSLVATSLVMLCFCVVKADSEKTYLNTGRAALIGISAGIPLLIEQVLPATDSSQRALIGRPVLLDDFMARKLGGEFHVGKSNFLNGDFGSTMTPTLGGIGLIIADFTWPENQPGKDVLQDVYVYQGGLWATAGVTGITKYLFARPRPFLHYFPDSAGLHESEYSEARKSFFSGHASSAFYSMTYLNKRVRTIMRQRLDRQEFRDWRWLPPTVLFTWSGYVCLTRIQAYQHYLSDVVVGALAGYLLAELFYSLGNDFHEETDTNAIEKPIFMITLRI